RVGAGRVLPANPVDRANRRAERRTGFAVWTGRLVLHLVGGTDAAAVRRLPAGKPVEAGQGRATAKSAGLSQSRALGLLRCREGAGGAVAIDLAGAPRDRSRGRRPQGIRGLRNPVARR